MQSFIKEKSMENVFDPCQEAFNMFFDDDIIMLYYSVVIVFFYFDGGRPTKKKFTYFSKVPTVCT